jgi:GntR family transcriptional regulator
MTVRSVVTQLVHDGLLYRVQGKGTFVARPKISAHSPAYKGVREQLEGMGYETVTKLLKIEKTADPNIRAILRLQPNESVFAIDRIRLIKDEPISIHRSYVPCALAPELMQYDVENEQLCAILEKNFGLKMKFVEESLETVSAMSSEAELLHVKRGYPLLLLEDVIYDENRCPFEYAKIIFRGDRIKLHFDYDA